MKPLSLPLLKSGKLLLTPPDFSIFIFFSTSFLYSGKIADGLVRCTLRPDTSTV